MSAYQPAPDALYLAVDWLLTYEGSDDDPNGEVLSEVADWLKGRADAAAFESQVREVAEQAAKALGKNPDDKQVRAAARRVLRRSND